LLFLEPEILKTKEIGVAGVFSDGVRRSIKGSSFGTTYQSSNQDVVTVDSEGVLHAIGIGKAIITIRNGDQTAKTDIEVRAKARP
jgi:chorismate synthase